MSNDPSETHKLDLRNAAVVTLLVIGIGAAVLLLYYLIDIVILLFLGIVVAAALQPWYMHLCQWGIPRGTAVILIYLLFATAMGLIGFLVVPVVVEEVSKFAAGFPEYYATTRMTLRDSSTPLLQLIGSRLPPFAALMQSVSSFSPSLFEGALGFTTGIATFFVSLVTVLVIGFYWTMEVPRLERLILSFFPVARRTQLLNIWHELEFKLGAFIRGQGLAMLVIGGASGLGYLLIGLPNVLVLAVLAGLLEAVPVIGPVLAAIPAVLIALPLGLTTVLLVIGLSALLQFFENNWLIPRVMSHAVGVSALVGLIAMLAFGTLYGVLGIFIAIPLAAVIQVLLDQLVINAEPIPGTYGVTTDPLVELRTRVRALRQELRTRLRERDTRMGIDAQTPDHLVDAADQHIEQAVERIDTMITEAQNTAEQLDLAGKVTLVEELEEATQHIKEAVDQVDTLMAAVQNNQETSAATVEMPIQELSHATQQVTEAIERVETVVVEAQNATGPLASTERGTIVGELNQATQQMKQAVGQVDTLMTTPQDQQEITGPTVEMPFAELSQVTQQVEAAVDHVEAVKIVTQESAEPRGPEEREVIVEELEEATQQIKQAVDQVDTLMAVAQGKQESSTSSKEAPPVEELQQATAQADEAVERAESAMTDVIESDVNGAASKTPNRKATPQSAHAGSKASS